MSRNHQLELMNAESLLRSLWAAGLRLRAEGNTICISPVGRLTDEQRALIRAHKPALLRLLSGGKVEPENQGNGKASSSSSGTPGQPTLKELAERVLERNRRQKAQRQQALVPTSSPSSGTWEDVLRAWIASLGEDEPDPVIEQCRRDPEARAYFLRQARSWARQERVRGMLSRNPTLRLAVVVEDEGSEFVAAVGVRGKGIAEYGISREKYDGLRLLELVRRHGGQWPSELEAAA